MKKTTFILLLLICSSGFSQSLFESAQSPSLSIRPSGSVKSNVYIGRKNDSLAFKSILTRADITLKMGSSSSAQAQVRLRLSNIYRSDSYETTLDLNEAFIKFHLLDFNFTLGKQFLPASRSDVFQLFSHYTPMDHRLLTPDLTDRETGLSALKTVYNFSDQLRGRLLILPVHHIHQLPLESMDLPANVIYRGYNSTEKFLSETGFAASLMKTGKRIDYSLNYQDIFHSQPLYHYSADWINQLVYLEALSFRHQVIGLDAAFDLGKWNTRFEGAYIHPAANDTLTLPEDSWEWTLGMDRSVSIFSLLVEYHGAYIPDYVDLPLPQDSFQEVNFMINSINRLYFRQLTTLSHDLFIKPSLSLFKETVQLHVPILFYFHSKEYLLSCQLAISSIDALNIKFGVDHYHGGENTLFNYTSDYYNSVYMHLEYSF